MYAVHMQHGSGVHQVVYMQLLRQLVLKVTDSYSYKCYMCHAIRCLMRLHQCRRNSMCQDVVSAIDLLLTRKLPALQSGIKLESGKCWWSHLRPGNLTVLILTPFDFCTAC